MQKVNGRTPSDGKSSHFLWQGELKINITMYIKCRHSPLSSQPHANHKCEIFSESKLNQKCHKTEIKLQRHMPTYAHVPSINVWTKYGMANIGCMAMENPSDLLKKP